MRVGEGTAHAGRELTGGNHSAWPVQGGGGEEEDAVDDLSDEIDEDEDDHFGARPTSLYDSPAEEPETVLQNKLRAEKGELTIDTFTRLTFGYRTILNKELKQLSLSIDWSRAFRDLRRAKADSQVGALLDAHATLRCLDADCGVGAFSMMLAEKLAAKKFRNKPYEGKNLKHNSPYNKPEPERKGGEPHWNPVLFCAGAGESDGDGASLGSCEKEIVLYFKLGWKIWFWEQKSFFLRCCWFREENCTYTYIGLYSILIHSFYTCIYIF